MEILQIAVEKQVFMSADIEKLFLGKAHTERSRAINRLRKAKLLTNLSDAPRKYVIKFNNNYLLRYIIEVLGKEGFIPLKD